MPSFIAGIVIFIESSITSLVAGAIGRPFCDKYGISRAKLAFVCDSTSAPVCSIIAINGWGALLLGLIGGQITAGLIAGEEAHWLISAIGYNFYAYIALIVTFLTIWYNIDIGPMKHAPITEPSLECDDEKGSVGLFLWPMVWMIGGSTYVYAHHRRRQSAQRLRFQFHLLYPDYDASLDVRILSLQRGYGFQKICGSNDL